MCAFPFNSYLNNSSCFLCLLVAQNLRSLTCDHLHLIPRIGRDVCEKSIGQDNVGRVLGRRAFLHIPRSRDAETREKRKYVCGWSEWCDYLWASTYYHHRFPLSTKSSCLNCSPRGGLHTPGGLHHFSFIIEHISPSSRSILLHT